MPGIARENYWFRRHEAAYRWVATEYRRMLAGADVVEAGCGEGYGAAHFAAVGARCYAVDLDLETIRHVRHTYAESAFVYPIRANLDALPVRDGTADFIVSMQVVEHLWDLNRFLLECLRVLRPGGRLIVTTPNRITFSPGLERGQRPANPFHVEEFDAEQLVELLSQVGFDQVRIGGLAHGQRIDAWERENGSVTAAQITAVIDSVWPAHLDSFIETVSEDDFEIAFPVTAMALDLVAIARRPER